MGQHKARVSDAEFYPFESTVMKKKPVVPRIIRILKVHGFVVRCMFNNGEVREVSFDKLFEEWKIREDDVEYPLLQLNEFAKVELRNFTLSWPNIVVSLIGEDGSETHHPYELSPEVLYSKSEPVPSQEGEHYGKLIKTARIKAGLTQEQLAQRSGTSRFYISRLENNRTDVELSTIRKIVEAGLGKHLKLIIE